MRNDCRFADRVKRLIWDQTGMGLVHKRLEGGKFVWPQVRDGVMCLSQGKTIKRDYVHVTPLPDAETVLALINGRLEDYNENHPHSRLKICSPREFIAAQTETA